SGFVSCSIRDVFIANVTWSSCGISAIASPGTAMVSANLPASMDPNRSSLVEQRRASPEFHSRRKSYTVSLCDVNLEAVAASCEYRTFILDGLKVDLACHGHQVWRGPCIRHHERCEDRTPAEMARNHGNRLNRHLREIRRQ